MQLRNDSPQSSVRSRRRVSGRGSQNFHPHPTGAAAGTEQANIMGVFKKTASPGECQPTFAVALHKPGFAQVPPTLSLQRRVLRARLLGSPHSPPNGCHCCRNLCCVGHAACRAVWGPLNPQWADVLLPDLVRNPASISLAYLHAYGSRHRRRLLRWLRRSLDAWLLLGAGGPATCGRSTHPLQLLFSMIRP